MAQVKTGLPKGRPIVLVLPLKMAAAEAARSRSEPASAARAGHPARGGRSAPQRQTGHGARKPDDDSAQEELRIIGESLAFHFPEHLNGVGEVGLEVLAHDVENLHQHRISNGIEDLVAVLAVHDNLVASQDRQVLREIRLFEAELLLDGPRGELPVAQQLKDGDAGGMGERVEDIGLVCAQRLLHMMQYIRYSEYTQ